MEPVPPVEERPHLLRPLRVKPKQREAEATAEAPEPPAVQEALERPLVFVRVRPDGGADGSIKVDGTNVTYPVPKKDRRHTISVERVFNESATQEEAQ